MLLLALSVFIFGQAVLADQTDVGWTLKCVCDVYLPQEDLGLAEPAQISVSNMAFDWCAGRIVKLTASGGADTDQAVNGTVPFFNGISWSNWFCCLPSTCSPDASSCGAQNPNRTCVQAVGNWYAPYEWNIVGYVSKFEVDVTSPLHNTCWTEVKRFYAWGDAAESITVSVTRQGAAPVNDDDAAFAHTLYSYRPCRR